MLPFRKIKHVFPRPPKRATKECGAFERILPFTATQDVQKTFAVSPFLAGKGVPQIATTRLFCLLETTRTRPDCRAAFEFAS